MLDALGNFTVADICLVNMPVVAVERPSIALGLLKAELEAAGMTVAVDYANMHYAEYIGILPYREIGGIRPEDGLADWLFGAVAFPDFEPDHEAYVDALRARNGIYRRVSREKVLGDLLWLRGLSLAFVDAVIDRILADRPRVVGGTSVFSQHVATLALLRRLKERAPDIVTIIGGANCEGEMGMTTHRHFPWVDYVVSGEADELIVPLMRQLLDRGTAVAAADLPFGVFGPIHRTAGYPASRGEDDFPRATVNDLRNLPLPDYADYFSTLDDFLYGDWIGPGIPVETSRGCWWGAKSHCTFCGLNGGSMQFRAKPPEQIKAEFDTMLDRYRGVGLEVVDNILDMGYFTTVLPALAEGPRRYNIFYETKSNLRRDQIEALAAAGIRWIQPGIESLDSRVLKVMRKGVTGAQNILLLKWAQAYGVAVMWSVLVGFPDELDEWHAETAGFLPALNHLRSGGMITLRYDRHSPYFRTPEAWGLDLVPSPLYRFVYPLAEAELARLVYYFENRGETITDRSLSKAETVGRPGLAAMQTAMQGWVAAQRRPEGRARLDLLRRASGAVVIDTRDGPTPVEHILDADELAVLDACDDGPAPPRLAQRLADMDEGLRDRALARLVEARLIVALDGRLVALTIENALPPPDVLDFPCGVVGRGLSRRTAMAEAAE